MKVFLLTILGLMLHQHLQAQTLVAHFPMNGNLNDVSGNGNNGTAQNGASLTADQYGNPNSAYFFDGSNDYIRYTSPNNAFRPNLPVTITAWVRKDDPSKSFLVFGNNFEWDYYNGVWLNINASNKVTGAFGDGGPVGPQSRRSKSGMTSLSTGVWHHVAVVIKGEKDMEIYLDGINDCGTYSGTGDPLSYDSNLPGTTARSDLKAASNSGNNHGEGEVNAIRMYDGVLSQSEIWDIAYGTAPHPTDTTRCLCESVGLDAEFDHFPFGINTVNFNDLTPIYSIVSPTYVVWDFGDGSPTEVKLPGQQVTHQFPAGMGPFNVCLSAYYFDGCNECTDVYCKMVDPEKFQ